MKPGRGIVWVLGLVLGLGLVGARTALAVQASGSLIVTPSNWGELNTNDEFTVAIKAQNTSTDTPAVVAPLDGTAPVPATLSGPITVQLACTLPCCGAQEPGRLAFVSVAPNGCVAKNAAVTGCVSAGPNTVTINLGSSITLPASGSVDIATIKVKVLSQTGLNSRLGIEASTTCPAIKACSSHFGSVCAECDATGCSKVIFPSADGFPCPHPCPAKIACATGRFEWHGIIHVSPTFDPPNQAFSVSLSNANGTIFNYTLPPGNIVDTGNIFQFTGVKGVDGIYRVRFGLRAGTTDAYRIDIEAYKANICTLATLPPMTTAFSIGADSFSSSETWTATSYGWIFQWP